MKSVLITGASGLVGTRLTEMLLEQGYSVSHVSRSKREDKNVTTYVWDVNNAFLELGALDGVDAIIHLAGAPLADKRWTENRKEEIIRSRVDSTALLYKELGKQGHNVATVICASGMSYYGMEDNEKVYTEADEPGTDFLAHVTRMWENEADTIQSLNIRVVKLRISVVLSDRGGALQSMSMPVKWFAGAPLGSGNQYMSWIHIDDLCRMIIKAIEDNRISGVFNAASPEPVTNREMTKGIANVLHRPVWPIAVPAFLLKIIVGEMADMVLAGINLSSQKIQQAGFEFKYKKLDEALKNLLITH